MQTVLAICFTEPNVPNTVFQPVTSIKTDTCMFFFWYRAFAILCWHAPRLRARHCSGGESSRRRRPCCSAEAGPDPTLPPLKRAMDRASPSARSGAWPSGRDRCPYEDPARRCTFPAVPRGGALSWRWASAPASRRAGTEAGLPSARGTTSAGRRKSLQALRSSVPGLLRGSPGVRDRAAGAARQHSGCQGRGSEACGGAMASDGARKQFWKRSNSKVPGR